MDRLSNAKYDWASKNDHTTVHSMDVISSAQSLIKCLVASKSLIFMIELANAFQRKQWQSSPEVRQWPKAGVHSNISQQHGYQGKSLNNTGQVYGRISRLVGEI